MIESEPPVPLVSPLIGEAEIAAVAAVLRSGHLAAGPEVAAFEREFGAFVGSPHAVAMSSGTAANHAALEALGIGDGDEVVTTPFTFAATATPILMQRAIPRFLDVDPRTFNLDPATVAAGAPATTRAAVLVDLFGHPVDPAGTSALRGRGIAFLEDACQAVGSSRDGVAAGAIGDVASFSFYATKNLATGEGGMLTTADAAVAERARRFRHHGQGSERYQYLSLGYNYRMTDIAAAIGRVQLGRLAAATAERHANAAFFDAELGGIPGLTLPYVAPGTHHAYHQYCVLVDAEATPNGIGRDAFRQRLDDAGVMTGIYYPSPLHLHPMFARFGYGPGDFPVAERLSARIAALPIHPHLRRDQLERVVRAVTAALGA